MSASTGLKIGETGALAASGQGTSGSVAPRLVAFYRDVWDDDGTAMGWQTVGWGLLLWDGSAISVPAVGPMRVTVWHSIDDALAELDTYIDDLGPRRSLDRSPVPVPQSSGSPPAAPDRRAADRDPIQWRRPVMSAEGAEVTVRWLPGLGASCPGAVDLTTVGPQGTITRAVSFPEALTLGLVADLLCPTTRWFETMQGLAANPDKRWRP